MLLLGTGVIASREVSKTVASRATEWLEKIGERDAKGSRHSLQRAHADVALATFDAADVVAVQIGSGCQLLLGNAGSQA